MKELELTQGYKAKVDDEDYETLSQHNWTFQRHHSAGGYAVASMGGENVLLHRFLVGAKPGEWVDHKNFDGLDNQRVNIRLATDSQNHWNQRIQRAEKSSKYKGVSWHKRHMKWRVQIEKYGINYHLGYFEAEKRAAFMYDTAAILMFGEFAATNATLLNDAYDVSEVMPMPDRLPNKNYRYDFDALAISASA